MKLIDLLLPYQREFVLDRHRFKIWNSSRQIGKSFSLGFISAYRALEKDNNLVLMISTGDKAAGELLKKSLQFADAIRILSDGQITYTHTSDSITFSNGGRILSLPSGNPAALRGWTSAATIIDEAAYIRNPDEVFQAISPTLTRNSDSQLILASTPAGRQGRFWDIWSEGGEEWMKYQTTIHDAIRGGLKVDLDGLRKLCPDPAVFSMEYECQFSRDMGAFIDPDLLDWYEEGGIPSGCDGYYLGVDFGRTNDATCMVVLRKVGEDVYVEKVIRMRNAEWQSQFNMIGELHSHYRFRYGYMDRNGIGSAISEQVTKRICSSITGYATTAQSKTPMYENTRAQIFNHRLHLPIQDRRMIEEDFANVVRVVSEDGRVSYSAFRNSSGHSDFTSALCMGLQSMKEHPVGLSMPIGYVRRTMFC